MAQNVTIAGASYSDVPAIEVPKTGGGTATFADPSDVTAGEADVRSGKLFLNSSGALRSGTLVAAEAIEINLDSFSTLPQTVSNAAITGNHIAVLCVPGTPSAQVDEWTVATADGSVTVSGSISGSTTLQLVLIKTGISI